MIPWLLVLEEMKSQGKKLSELIDERMAAFPVSGEINRRIQDPARVIAGIKARYVKDALSVDETDGVSIEFKKWRFNLRMSNTEPVVRLNVESRADPALMKEKTEELLALLGA
jgi:phosphomannomutase